VWTQFTLSFIASIASFVIIVAISVSLYRKRHCGNAAVSPRSGAGARRRRTTTSGPDYSSYNLYLVLLAIPDLAYNLFLLGIVTDEYYNGWLLTNDAMITICATCNMYMNVVIAFEVMTLLRRTKHCQRYIPPTYKKVGIQFGVVASYAIVLGIVWYCLLRYFMWNGNTHNAEFAISLRQYSMPVFYVLVWMVPTLALLVICFLIWKQQLLPKGQVGWSQGTPSSTSRGSNGNRNKLWWQRGPISRSTNSTDTTTSSSVNQNNKGVSATSGNTGNAVSAGVNKSSNNNGDSTAAATDINNRNSQSTATTNSSTAAVANPTSSNKAIRGRLNILAMYFLRIILVFFCTWFPGMIMYYNAYTTNRNSAGIQHNLAMIFFSLQAILSFGMAMTKPDVRKSVYDLGQIFNPCKWCHPKPVVNTNNGRFTMGNGIDDNKDEGGVEVDIEAPPPLPLENHPVSLTNTTAKDSYATNQTKEPDNVKNDELLVSKINEDNVKDIILEGSDVTATDVTATGVSATVPSGNADDIPESLTKSKKKNIKQKKKSKTKDKENGDDVAPAIKESKTRKKKEKKSNRNDKEKEGSSPIEKKCKTKDKENRDDAASARATCYFSLYA